MLPRYSRRFGGAQAKTRFELLRPYVPKGEAITWTILADARAVLPRPVAAKPLPPPPVQGLAGDGRLIAVVTAFVSALYAVLVAKKSEETARHARARGVEPLPMLRVPSWLRSLLAGPLLGAGIYLELVAERATVGAMLVVGAMVCAAYRTPRWTAKHWLRGPGHWLPMADTDAFREPERPRDAYLDVSTAVGKALFAASILGVLALATCVLQSSLHGAVLVALDGAALLAVFGTGRIAESSRPRKGTRSVSPTGGPACPSGVPRG